MAYQPRLTAWVESAADVFPGALLRGPSIATPDYQALTGGHTIHLNSDICSALTGLVKLCLFYTRAPPARAGLFRAFSAHCFIKYKFIHSALRATSDGLICHETVLLNLHT